MPAGTSSHMEIEVAEQGHVLVGTKLVRLRGPMACGPQMSGAVYVCSGARRTKELAGNTGPQPSTDTAEAGSCSEVVVVEGGEQQPAGSVAGPDNDHFVRPGPSVCGQPLFWPEDVLSRSHAWDAGGGIERAVLVNGLLSNEHQVGGCVCMTHS